MLCWVRTVAIFCSCLFQWQVASVHFRINSAATISS
uniref:Uncharacterized protein n=1 Tax=Anguilla anguilla TaxID=7936 RepID=A0A0E9TDA7_ANGAN